MSSATITSVNSSAFFIPVGKRCSTSRLSSLETQGFLSIAEYITAENPNPRQHGDVFSAKNPRQ